MPTYHFKDTETGEEFEVSMKISELDEYRAANPTHQTVIKAAAVTYRTSSDKPDNGFRDVLKEIKKNNDQHFTKTNINTW